MNRGLPFQLAKRRAAMTAKRSGAAVGGRDPGAAATSRTGKATDCRYKDYDGNLCVSITAVPITKLFARGGRGEVEDMCYEGLRAEAYVN